MAALGFALFSPPCSPPTSPVSEQMNGTCSPPSPHVVADLPRLPVPLSRQPLASPRPPYACRTPAASRISLPAAPESAPSPNTAGLDSSCGLCCRRGAPSNELDEHAVGPRAPSEAT